MPRTYHGVVDTIADIVRGTIALEDVKFIQLLRHGATLDDYRAHYVYWQNESSECLDRKLLFDAFVEHHMILEAETNWL